MTTSPSDLFWSASSLVLLVLLSAWAFSALKHRQVRIGGAIFARDRHAIAYWVWVVWLGALMSLCASLFIDFAFGIDVRFWL